MIAVEHLTKWYGDVLAVNDISFTVPEGEVVGFLGPNGAGKSTTLKILSAFQPASEGVVRIDDLDVLKDSLAVRRRLGYLPETVPIYSDMRVEEFLRFRAALKGVARRDIKRMVETALDRCGCLDMRRRMVGKLSKGYRQRVGLSDAIVHDPPILILDEPTSGLDPNQRVEVRRLISSLGEDKTVLLSSHILAEVEAVAERVIIIREGEVVADGSPTALLEQEAVISRVWVESSGPDVGPVLRALPGVTGVSENDRGDGWTWHEVIFDKYGDYRHAVAQAVLEAGGSIRELTMPSDTLEDLFRRLTSNGPLAKGTQ